MVYCIIATYKNNEIQIESKEFRNRVGTPSMAVYLLLHQLFMWMVNTDHKLHNRFIFKDLKVLQSSLNYSVKIFHAF
jgi:hypothetical protein